MKIVLIIVAVLAGFAILIGIGLAVEKGSGDLPLEPTDPSLTVLDRPPTDRQLNFIDNLIAEREVEPWMIEHDPQTLDEASDLIELLLAQPRRDDPGDD